VGSASLRSRHRSIQQSKTNNQNRPRPVQSQFNSQTRLKAGKTREAESEYNTGDNLNSEGPLNVDIKLADVKLTNNRQQPSSKLPHLMAHKQAGVIPAPKSNGRGQKSPRVNEYQDGPEIRFIEGSEQLDTVGLTTPQNKD